MWTVHGVQRSGVEYHKAPILGPLLFIIYINDLTKYLKDGSSRLYADNTAICMSSNCYVDLLLCLKIEMECIFQLLKANRLTLNLKKTKYMVFGTRQKLSGIDDIKLTTGDGSIDRVDTLRYLAIALDSSLTFQPHLENTYKKACKQLSVVRKVRNCLNKNVSLMLYKSLILPHLHYRNTIYMCASKEHVDKLQLIQNKACRIIFKVHKRTSIDYMQKHPNLFMVSGRRTFHMQWLCHKNIFCE